MKTEMEKKAANMFLGSAVKTLNFEAVKQALEDGADINSFDDFSGFLSRVRMNDDEQLGLEMMELMYDSGYDFGGKKFDLDEKSFVELLIYMDDSVGFEHADFIEKVIRDGADVNAIDKHGNTPLHYAAQSLFSGPLVDLLLEHGANVNAVNIYGASSLHFASSCGGAENVRTLVQYGADVNAIDDDDNTSLISLVCSGADTDMVKDAMKVLLGAGANIDVQDMDKDCALRKAIFREDAELVAFLLEHGADTSIKDGEGLTALEAATKEAEESGRFEVLDVIRSFEEKKLLEANIQEKVVEVEKKNKVKI